MACRLPRSAHILGRPSPPIQQCDPQGFDDYSGRTILSTMDDAHSMEKVLGDIPAKSWSCKVPSYKHNIIPVFNARKTLEFTCLVGLFTFQAFQHAIAATELAGVQTMTYFGYLGDINTGFASVYFGVTSLLDAASDDGQQSTDEQKESELASSEFSGDGAGNMAAASTVLSTFILVFVAEWGDKSFFSTIALATACSPWGVIGGALAGHAFAILVIPYVGGILFLVYAVVTLMEILRLSSNR